MNQRPSSVSDAAILDAVDAAMENGDHQGLLGGVLPEHVAKHCALTAATLRSRLLTLSKRGELVQVDGCDTSDPAYAARKGYLPADHPDASSPYRLP
ncbi:hypothetical protein NDI56_04055 [Haloarcula sp. S1CR25-12]|uniref:ArsR family transcriptional regulator n=1 Tax=Haloarcula saliterrae TaxID=2950534 RepID=A0ABU2F8K7_9EURY|nr:hypothetical protein [Haloarcula sp. S1CR25-12]MDS0258584.1 hypothetical protein [Haloarcula sp. S1CR25-12]